jgi:hypothetical protein
MTTHAVSKKCIKCSAVLPVSEFYTHPYMADGRLGKCKSCCRSAAIANRRLRIDYYREYDRERFSTERRQDCLSKRQRRYREANPVKTAARAAVNRSVRSGALEKKPCEVCGAVKVDAHHDDYAKPLHVRWLCRRHHLELHVRQAAASN